MHNCVFLCLKCTLLCQFFNASRLLTSQAIVSDLIEFRIEYQGRGPTKGSKKRSLQEKSPFVSQINQCRTVVSRTQEN